MLGKILGALDWKIVLYILWPFEIFYGHLGFFMTIVGTFCVQMVHFSPGFGITYQEKSGNPYRVRRGRSFYWKKDCPDNLL
jgi:hypothetical protein